MPYIIPKLTIKPDQCFEDSTEQHRQTLLDIIDIFKEMNHTGFKDLPLGCGIDKFIEKNAFNIYLTGGRAYYLVLKALKPRLSGVFWESFDWTLCEQLYSQNRDYDIQCCWRDEVIVRSFDEIMRLNFRFMKERIRAHYTHESQDTLSCSSDDIDIVWIQKTVKQLDSMNNQFRINLLTHEVECLSEEGLRLFIHEHQVDIPLIEEYIKHPNKNRAMSKMTFAIRNSAKALLNKFIYSPKTQAAFVLATQNRAYAQMINSYAKAKIQELMNDKEDTKLKYMTVLAGSDDLPWVERILKQDRKNRKEETPSLAYIPAATAIEILNNIQRLIEVNRDSRYQAEAIDLYFKNSLRFHISEDTLKTVAEALEHHALRDVLFKKHVTNLKNLLSKKTEPSSPSPASSNGSSGTTATAGPSNEPKTTQPMGSPPLTPAYSNRAIPVHKVSRNRKDLVAELQKNIQAQGIDLFKKDLNYIYESFYYDCSMKNKWDDYKNSHFAPYLNSSMTRKYQARIKDLANTLITDERLAGISMFDRSCIMIFYTLIGICTYNFVFRYASNLIPNIGQDNLSRETAFCFESCFVICFMILGIRMAHSPNQSMIALFGLNDCCKNFSEGMTTYQENKSDQTLYDTLYMLGMILIYNSDLHDVGEVGAFNKSAALFLKDPSLKPGLQSLTCFVHQYKKTDRSKVIRLILMTLVEFNIKEITHILRDPRLKLSSLDINEIRQVFTVSARPVRNGEQSPPRPPLPNLQI